jgi:hypothetical protein
MKRNNMNLLITLAALAATTWGQSAHAEGSDAGGTRPNRTLITSGIVTLGISYGAAAIVGAQSDHDGDKSLLVPVAGPWMDLTSRGGCDVSPCGHETANKVLLVADGIVQALGALDIVLGFVMPERVSTAKAYVPGKVAWGVTPVSGDRGYGLAAVGTF